MLCWLISYKKNFQRFYFNFKFYILNFRFLIFFHISLVKLSLVIKYYFSDVKFKHLVNVEFLVRIKHVIKNVQEIIL